MTKRILSIVTTTDPLTRQLGDLARQLQALSLPGEWQLELVVVDDLGFWQNHAQGAAELTFLMPSPMKSRLVWYAGQRGQLAALAAGVLQASGEAILTIDPDLHHCCHQIPALLARYSDGAKILHGVRHHRRDISVVRKTGSCMTNLLTRYLSGLRVPDLGSPVMLFPVTVRAELQQAMAAGAHPRLYLYLKYADALETFPLDTSAVPPHPSHYRFIALCRTAYALFRQCVATRRYCQHILVQPVRSAEP